MLEIGKKIPSFKVPNQNNELITDKKIKGKWKVIYFYPRDNTPGCTTEACDFTDNIAKFNSLNCEIFGVSTDSIESHQKFITKKNIQFDLLADTENKMCESFGVWQEKNNYGKKYMGIVRSTFLFDTDNCLVHQWQKVKVADHVKQVMEILKKNI